MSKHEELIERLRYFDRLACNDAIGVIEAQAREIEGLRKQDDALILQLVEALETCNEGDGYNGPYQYHNEIAVESAITAGRARLEGKT